MPDDVKSRPLTLELDPQGDNVLEQLVASLRRIEAGLDGIHELLSAVVMVDRQDGSYVQVQKR